MTAVAPTCEDVMASGLAGLDIMDLHLVDEPFKQSLDKSFYVRWYLVLQLLSSKRDPSQEASSISCYVHDFFHKRQLNFLLGPNLILESSWNRAEGLHPQCPHEATRKL